MIFEEFSPAAIACAIGWMAARADRQLRDDYFARWACALLVDDNPAKFTFEQLTDFENEIRRRYESAGLAHLAPNLAEFVAHNEHLKARRAPRPGDAARAAGRPLYADECPECRQDPCVCAAPAAAAFPFAEPGRRTYPEYPARIVIQDAHSGRTLWEKAVTLVKESRTSSKFTTTEPLEPVRLEFAGTIEMFVEIPELEPLGIARVPFRVPATGAPGQNSINIKWPVPLCGFEVS